MTSFYEKYDYRFGLILDTCTLFTDLAEVLWSSFYDFVKRHSTTLTPPASLADIAAGFTLMTLQLYDLFYFDLFIVLLFWGEAGGYPSMYASKIHRR